MTVIRPRRSVLYLPGSNARALEKARTLPADVLILDLEDAVAPEMKAQAREHVCAAVKEKLFGARETVIRINGHDTEWAEADLDAAIAAKPDAVLLPKIDNAAGLQPVEQRLLRETNSSIALWAMIETPSSIFHLNDIAGAGGSLTALVFGRNDLLKAMRARSMPDRDNLVAALSMTVLAARANSLAAIDGVFNDLQDSDSFIAECGQGRAFGFDGKTLIHPSQLADCNRIFAPSEDEITQARKVIAAFDFPENKHKGAIRLDGHMVERLHLEMARRTVALAEIIAGREQREA